ncbi:M-phase phosphoprotein 6 [Chelonus insularis]|uniref:M-phase phosphoprotein 6 n=1 Tax=Chelonus insularis TaxID=460826 RepID=UPI00158AE8A7|nr:M-phase phosphoprotein 6 [Chelonus insularis]
MGSNDYGKMQLSKSILEMKFMKRTKEKVELQQFQAEGEEYFENELTARLKKATEKFTMEPSYVFCEQLIEGRLSFRGMNPEIEKIMEHEAKMKRAKIEIKKETDISDEKMAKHFENSRVISMGKKFQTKRNRSQFSSSITESHGYSPVKKKMFLKPAE